MAYSFWTSHLYINSDADRMYYIPLRADYHGGEGKGVPGRKFGLGAGGRKGRRVLSPEALRPHLCMGECRGAYYGSCMAYGHSKHAELRISKTRVLLADE
jgi:hypothetical protein